MAAIIILSATLVLMLFLSIGFLTVQLVTEIREDGVVYKFRPLQRKFRQIKFTDIETVEVKKYNPVREYGGWGIRIGGKKRGKAYNVSGNMGIHFVFSDGRKFLLGTHKPESVKKVLQRLLESPQITHPEFTERR
jgi:hypothetical protein